MFDFDGPVCSVFAGRPAPKVAQRLRKLVEAAVPLPPELSVTTDPMVFLQAAPHLPADVGEMVRLQLEADERAAIESAEPTPGAHAAIADCARASKVVSIVSNNDAEAVATYLARHGLGNYVSYISARRSPDPTLMKPHPHLVLAAIEAAGRAAELSVLIGDSVTDIEAARAARTASIGYANKFGKFASFEMAGADAIITDMHEISQWLG